MLFCPSFAEAQRTLWWGLRSFSTAALPHPNPPRKKSHPQHHSQENNQQLSLLHRCTRHNNSTQIRVVNSCLYFPSLHSCRNPPKYVCLLFCVFWCCIWRFGWGVSQPRSQSYTNPNLLFWLIWLRSPLSLRECSICCVHFLGAWWSIYSIFFITIST